jgi:hypothetical protein
MAVDPVSIVDQRRRRSRLLALEVIKVLKCMGGSAHADAIVDAVSSRRRQQNRDVPERIGKTVRDVLSMFETGGKASEAINHPLFYRPFGSESHRWSLSQGAMGPDLSLNVIEEVEAILSESAAASHFPDGIETARRRMLSLLGDGSRCAPVDLMVLDELERRGDVARLRVRH